MIIPNTSFIQMARRRISSLDGRGIGDFDELILKKIHRILRSCLIALYFVPTTLTEIAVYSKRSCFVNCENHAKFRYVCLNRYLGSEDMTSYDTVE